MKNATTGTATPLALLLALVNTMQLNSYAAPEESLADAKARWADLRPRVAQFETSAHSLAAYVAAQREIVERLFTAIEADLARPGALFQADADVQTVELVGLLASLTEELELAGRNAEFAQDVRVRTVNVMTDCGAAGDGAADDGPAIRAAIGKATALGPGSRVYLPKGTYAIHKPAGGGMLVLDGVKDLAIEAEQGTILLMKAVSAGIVIRNSRNVTIRNVGIDYDPLPFTQGKIVNVDAEGSTIDVRVQTGFPRPDLDYFRKARYLRGTMRDPDSGNLHPHSGDPRITEVEHVDGSTFRLTLADNGLRPYRDALRRYATGRPFVIQARQTPGGGPAWQLSNSEYVTMAGTKTYASFVHIAVVAGCTGVKIRDCVAEPLPGSGRLTCCNADGIHCPSNRRGPLIENCRFSRINDDDVNIYGKCYSVARRDGPTALTLERGAAGAVGDSVNTPLLRPGDTVAVVSLLDGTVRGVSRVVETKIAEWQGDRKIQLVLDRPVAGTISRDDVGRGRWIEREYVSQSGKLDAAEDVVVNLNAKGDGFVVRNCDFGHHRANGIKIQASNGIVEDNRVEDVPGSAIWLWSGFNWLESYPPHNVVIRGNTLINPKGISGSITVLGKGRRPQRMIRNMLIENNSLEKAGRSGITFFSARDIIIRGNTILSPRPVSLTNCAAVQVRNNRTPAHVKSAVNIGRFCEPDTIVQD